MWYILIFQTGFIFVQNGLSPFHSAGLELVINKFLLLGIIPGTNIAITFNWFIFGFWLVFFYWLITKLYLNQFEKYRSAKKIIRINRLSL